MNEMVKRFGATVLPDARMTRTEAKRAISDIRSEASSFPDMTLDQINAEIAAVRAERPART